MPAASLNVPQRFRPADGYHRRRCLGPSAKEHFFLSAHPSERVCPDCRRRQDEQNLSSRAMGCRAPAVEGE